MPKSPPLSVAIIGAGGIAHAHAHALAELPDRARLAAVAEVDTTKAAEFAEKFQSGHRLQIEAVLDALAAGTEPGVSLAEARRTMEFAAATYASAFRGRPVAAGELSGDDPFIRSMDGGAVPWAPIKETTA